MHLFIHSSHFAKAECNVCIPQTSSVYPTLAFCRAKDPFLNIIQEIACKLGHIGYPLRLLKSSASIISVIDSRSGWLRGNGSQRRRRQRIKSWQTADGAIKVDDLEIGSNTSRIQGP